MVHYVQELAERLERDIRSRGLAPGHKYLTGPESALLLGTSVATANRALQILAGRGIVVRRRSSGTFVGPAMAANNAPRISGVCVFSPSSEKLYGTVRLDLLVEGLLANMHDVADVRMCYVPNEGGLDFVRSVIEPALRAAQLVGVIAIDLPYDVYRFLGDSGVPLVVMGALYPGQRYPSVDADERGAGYLLAHYLIERGHRRLAMLSKSESCPGNHCFHDGVSEALTEAGLPHNTLILRTPGSHNEVLRGHVKQLLTMPDRPTGFIVGLPRWVDVVAAMAREHDLKVPSDVEIVFREVDETDTQHSGFSHVRLQMPSRERAHLVGRMLAQSRLRVPLVHNNVVIPYEVHNAYGPAR